MRVPKQVPLHPGLPQLASRPGPHALRLLVNLVTWRHQMCVHAVSFLLFHQTQRWPRLYGLLDLVGRLENESEAVYGLDELTNLKTHAIAALYAAGARPATAIDAGLENELFAFLDY